MKKETKRYLVIAKLHRLSDYDDPMDQVIEKREYYRSGVSEEQVISRLKHEEHLYSYDNERGSVAYEWKFQALVMGVDHKADKQECMGEQLRLFNMED